MIKYVLTLILTFLAFAFVSAQIDITLWTHDARVFYIICALFACVVVFLIEFVTKNPNDDFNER